MKTRIEIEIEVKGARELDTMEIGMLPGERNKASVMKSKQVAFEIIDAVKRILSTYNVEGFIKDKMQDKGFLNIYDEDKEFPEGYCEEFHVNVIEAKPKKTKKKAKAKKKKTAEIPAPEALPVEDDVVSEEVTSDE